MNYLIDTCVISELIRANPSEKILKWIRKQNETDLYLSVLTIGEIFKGIEKVQDLEKKKRLNLWVENDLKERFKNRILPVDLQVSMVWGNIQGKAEKEGRPMPVIDGLIAATGLAYHLAVVTRNVSDMMESGVVLINPWDK